MPYGHQSDRSGLDIPRGRFSSDDVDFFSSPVWFETFAETCLEPIARSHIFVDNHSSPEQAARVLLALRSPAHQPGSSLPRLIPAAGSLASMTGYQSNYYSPFGGLCPDDDDVRRLSDLLRHASRGRGVLDFSYCDPRNGTIEAIHRAAQMAGLTAFVYDYQLNCFETVAGRTYKEYLAGRPTQLRNTLKRKRTALGRSGSVTFEILDGRSETEHHLTRYHEVQAASWKEPEPFPRFTDTILRRAAEFGALRLGFLLLDGVPIATQAWIVSQHRASIYKLHYAQAFAEFYPGTLLTADMFAHAIDVDAVTEIDFGVGDAPHKRQWLSQARMLGGVVAFNTATASGRLGLAIWRAYSPLAPYIAEARHAARQAIDWSKGLPTCLRKRTHRRGG